MVKPFEMLELLVRIEKVLERTGRAKKVLTVRNILVDMQSHQVYKDGLPVSLKPMEYDLSLIHIFSNSFMEEKCVCSIQIWKEVFDHFDRQPKKIEINENYSIDDDAKETLQEKSKRMLVTEASQREM